MPPQDRSRSGSADRGTGRGAPKSGDRRGGNGKSSADGKSGHGKSDRAKTGFSSAGSSSGSGKKGYQQGRGSRADAAQSGVGDRGGTPRRRDLEGAAVNLPNWVIDDLARVTPKDRVAPALRELGAASAALSDGRFHAALKHGRKAKDLSPRDATVRETLGIAAYRVGEWAVALTELRTYRRLAGDTTHMPVEMDALRALGRPADVEKAWNELNQRGGKPLALKEGAVVYGSFLIDNGRYDEAWTLTRPKRLGAEPHEAELRVWYVAARAAALRGDIDEARRIADAIVVADPAFPGIDLLEKEIRRAR